MANYTIPIDSITGEPSTTHIQIENADGSTTFMTKARYEELEAAKVEPKATSKK